MSIRRSIVAASLALHGVSCETVDVASQQVKETKPKKVAVLGSGLGAMSSLFYMTNYPGWEQDWDIDVYQLGWRIGGKAASGRTMNAKSGSRILEHGLHIFFAGYSNAIGWAKDMYKVWDRPAHHPMKSVNDAFKGSCNSDFWVNLESLGEPADWAIINQEDPLNKGWQCLYTLPENPEPAPTPWKTFKKLVAGIARTTPPTHRRHIGDVLDLIARCSGPPDALQRDALLALLRPLQSHAKSRVAAVEANEVEHNGLWPPPGWCNAGKTNLPATHKACSVFFWRATYMELSVAVGYLADNILLRGCERPPIEYESLDTWICRHHGPCGLEKDDLIRGLPFHAMFGFINGDLHKPNISAANLLCNFFVHHGMLGIGRGRLEPSAAYRMQAGMGEIIMTPAYEILKARGVRFHFFHKVEALRTSDGEIVDAIDIDVQATVKAGSTAYDPLHPVKGLNVWPDLSSPANCDGCDRFFDQLEEGEAIRSTDTNLESYYSQWPGSGLKKELKVGVDFDLVVNGISSGALPWISQDLVTKNEQWRNFVETTKTVATVGLQVWTYNTTAELGYTVPNVDPTDLSRSEVLASSGPEPLDTWADMTHLTLYETSNASATAGEPKSTQYWCSPIEFDPLKANFSDPTVPAVLTERVYDVAVRWLEKYTADIMPNWADALYESMVAPPDVVGRDRLRHQYYRFNHEPTELYVLSVGGSIKYRPVPWPTKEGDVHPFKNMAMAGDSTRNGFNIGAAEAAVTSGCHLAHALTNKQSPRRYVGHGHNQEHLLGNLADPDHYPLVGEEDVFV